MDYWCSLWFWDVRDAKDLPTRTEWYNDLVQILNINLDEATSVITEDEDALRDYRKDRKIIEKQLADAMKQGTDSLFTNQRANKIQEYAQQYLFFHYELEFIEVFREKNGFDLAVGNPPWVNITFDETGVVSEFYPEVDIRKFSAPKVRKLAEKKIFENENLKDIYKDELNEAETSKVFVGSYQNYPLVSGQRNNLYKMVLENGLNWITEQGYLGLIHPESIYDDPNGFNLRKEIYQRLKYHFQFQNAFNLFAEVAHREKYGIHIYSGISDEVNFFSINNIFHPSTIDGCFIERTILEPVQGLKVKNEQTGSFEWNISSHPSRIVNVSKETLRVFATTFENSEKWEGAKLVSIHAKEIVDIIRKIGEFPNSVKNYLNKITNCWNETTDVNAGNIQRETKYPDIENYEMIYSGPHLYVGNPLYKNPREICIEKADYDIIDLSQIDDNFIARTNYLPTNIEAGYGSIIKGFQIDKDTYDNWLDYYKNVFRKRLSQAGERTLIGAITLPRTAHIQTATSAVFKNKDDLIELTGLTSSLCMDFYIKTLGIADLYPHTLNNFPLGIHNQFKPALFSRTLQLNCLNKYYAPLWEESWQEAFKEEQWSVEDERLKPFSSLSKEWSWDTPLRNYFERRQALVEIDVITAMALGLSLDELILMYNIQFPVLQQNEDDTWYDTKGNIVFTCSKGLVGVGLDRPEWEKIKDMQAGETYEHTITKSELYYGEKVTYHPPFTKQDRVEDYKKAWVHFEEQFKE